MTKVRLKWTTEPFSKASGPKTVAEKAKAFKSGRTAASTLVTGRMTSPTVRADSSMLMEMYTRVSGRMTRRKEEVTMNIQMRQSTTETGRKIDSMALESKHGLTMHDMKVTTSLERNMVSVTLSGPMDLRILVSSIVTIFMERAFTLGMMDESTMGTGSKTKCTEKAPLPGQTAVNI
jgi:hypothetical protein